MKTITITLEQKVFTDGDLREQGFKFHNPIGQFVVFGKDNDRYIAKLIHNGSIKEYIVQLEYQLNYTEVDKLRANGL